jgi:hypothetical protein
VVRTSPHDRSAADRAEITRAASNTAGVRRTATAAAGSAGAALLALLVASAAALPTAGLPVLVAIGLGLFSRQWFALAGRSRVAARSEDEVRRSLAPLKKEGWRLRHSLSWQGPGDIDSVAIALDGVAVVIETKTRTHHDGHLARVLAQAAWLSHRRRRWCRNSVVAMLCLVRAGGWSALRRT